MATSWRTVAIYISRSEISCNFKGAIKEQTHGTKARTYREQKKRFNDGTADDVEWQVTVNEETVKAMQQGTGKIMVRRKERKFQNANMESKEIDEKIDNEFKRGFHRIQAETGRLTKTE